MATALRRLAILETQPLRTPTELLEWNMLRQWVIRDDLLMEYRNQDFFAHAGEVTVNQLPPKNPHSIFSRFWTFLKKAGTKRK